MKGVPMPQPWSALFQINRAPMMALNLQGISQDMADATPAEGLNSITWILAHIVTYRRVLLEEILRVPFDPALAEPTTLPELKAAIEEVQSALAKAFDAVQDWSAMQNHPVLPSPMPLDQIVGAFLSHDAYHAGQLGTARRLLGLPGALKLPEEAVHA